MSEYWKSNPRKLCDFCKCWIADNKPSIEFHERGKRHKENVQIRLAEMAKKGKEDYEAKLQEDDFLKSMEEAAMKAYKNDIEQNPDMTGVKISEIAKASNAELVVGKKTAAAPYTTTSTTTTTTTTTSKPSVATPKVWHEAKSPEGTSYYWNIETGESVWEVPKEGFLSLKEQDKLTKKKNSDSCIESSDYKPQKKLKSTDSTGSTSTTASCIEPSAQKKPKSTISAAPVTYGPAPKAEAYSSWQSVEREGMQTQGTDLQLPEIAEESYNGPEVVMSKPEVSFKEKVVKLAHGVEGGGAVGFKKRKAQQENRNLMKRRNDL